MAHRRYWITPLIMMLLVACGQSAAPTATVPDATVAVTFAPLPSPTDAADSSVAPTRTVSGAMPTPTVAPVGDTRYADPQGRFSIIIPKEWQPRPPTGTTGGTLISFGAPDGTAGLTIGLDTIALGTTAKEFAANTDKVNAGRMTNYRKQGQESLTVGAIPAEALTYQGTVGNKGYLFRQILLAQGADGWSITFPLDPAARQRYGPLVDAITQSFTVPQK